MIRGVGGSLAGCCDKQKGESVQLAACLIMHLGEQ